KALDAHLDALMSPALTAQAARTAAGLHERWTWDVVRPWIAVALGVAGPALALWLGLLSRRLTKPWLVIALLRFLAVALAALSAKKAFELWTTSMPELRDRVRPWIKWAVAGAGMAAVVWLLWDDHRNWALGLAVAFAAAIV